MRKKLTKRAVDALEARDGTTQFVWDTEYTGFGLKVTPKGRKVYILQYRLPGEGRQVAPKRMTLGKHGEEFTADNARQRAKKLLLRIANGEDPRPERKSGEPAEPEKLPTVADLATRFIKEYLPSKKRPPRESTIDYYDSIFRCHILPRLGDTPVAEVVAADVEHLHSAMRSTPYAANRTLSTIQYAFDQAERWGWRAQHTNPALNIDRYPEDRRGAKREVMLTPEQMAGLLDAIETEEESEEGNPYAVAAIRVAFWTGWRIGEILALWWENLDLDAGMARLIRTKTATEEYRQLPAEAVTVLRGLTRLAGSPCVFPGRYDRGHLATVKKPWQRIRERAGLDNLPGLGAFRLHDLRHNVVSWDVSRGVPLEIAGKNVGHRSRRSTEVYAHFAPTALKRAADERAAAMRAAVEGVK